MALRLVERLTEQDISEQASDTPQRWRDWKTQQTPAGISRSNFNSVVLARLALAAVGIADEVRRSRI